MDHPLIVCVISLLSLWLSAQSGAYLRRRRPDLEGMVREDLGIILAAALTLHGRYPLRPAQEL